MIYFVWSNYDNCLSPLAFQELPRLGAHLPLVPCPPPGLEEALGYQLVPWTRQGWLLAAVLGNRAPPYSAHPPRRPSRPSELLPPQAVFLVRLPQVILMIPKELSQMHKWLQLSHWLSLMKFFMQLVSTDKISARSPRPKGRKVKGQTFKHFTGTFFTIYKPLWFHVNFCSKYGSCRLSGAYSHCAILSRARRQVRAGKPVKVARAKCWKITLCLASLWKSAQKSQE